MVERAHPELAGFSDGSPYREHLFRRYAFATKHVNGKTVLDIPCGVGWGTSLLNAKHTIGMDISKDAIAFGKKNYPGIDFLVGSMAKISLKEKSIEIIVCLEGFEHVNKSDGQKFLKEAERILANDGKIVLTCPVILPGETHTGNPYHLYEPTIEEFNKIIKEKFKVENFEIIEGPDGHIAYFVGKKRTNQEKKVEISYKLFSSDKKNVLLTTSSAPPNTPFSTTEKRPPIGIGYLISVLRNEGHKVFFIDNYLESSNFLETNYLLEHEIDIVGIYTNTICFRDTLRMLYRLEDMRLSQKWYGKIVVGGPHASVAPEMIPHFVDHVVIGEGEYALRDIAAGKVKDRVVKYPPIEDLDELPMPAWEYFAKLPYDWNDAWLPEGPVFTMNTSRGCPFNCSFCSVGSIWGKRYTCHSAERIISEIEYLIKYHGAKGIYFREDNFTLNKKRLRKFCNIITKRKINIPWVCETRASNLNHEIVQLMARAGAKGFYIGVESGSQKTLDFLNKNITLKDIRRAFRLCKEFGINTAASIIVGVPNETEQDIKLTINLLNEIKPTVIWFNVFVGIPNSKLYQYIVDSKQYEFIDDRGLVYLEGHNKRVNRWYGNTWDARVPIKIHNKCIVEPKVSVIMAVHNGEKHLNEAIQSVISQTFNNYELIIVNDGSTDNTLNILSKWNDPRIVTLTNTENIGLTKSLNRAIEYCQGEYLARMDADDLSHPLRFEKQIAFLDKHPEHALVGSSYYIIDEVGRTKKHIKVHIDSAKLKIALKEQNWFAHGSVMMRKSSVLDVGGYDENYVYAQDYDLWLKISEKYEVANIEEPLYFWRSTEGTITQKKSKEQKNYAELARRKAKARTQKPRTKYLTRNDAKSTLVSVIVPTYNRPQLLLQAIKSIHEQTFNDYEIIVINDGGIPVENVLKNLHDRSDISYVGHSYNRGLAAARNTGIKIARGKYIAYLDDDDIFYPDHLATLADHLENTDSKVAYTDTYRSHQIHRNGEYVAQKRDLPYSLDFDRDRLLVGNYIPVLCFMHEKSCLDATGLFDETLTSHEDWDLWIRMSLMYKFDHIRKVTAEFSWRTDGSTMTSGKSRDMVETLERIYCKHRDLVNNKPHIAEAQRKHLEERKKTLRLSDSFPKCSIIIPVCNNLSLTGKCINEIFKVTPNDLYEVIVVDNASKDGTKEYLKSLGDRIKVITNIENKGFAVACNQGAKLANKELLVFLNNDTVPIAGWLEAMVACAENDDNIGVVGSKLLYPDGTIQHAGIEFINGLPDHPFRNEPGDMPEANTMRELDMVTGACLMIKKEIFEQCNGFDENYRNGVEDVDLCLKVRELGFKVVYNPQSTLYHHEGKTAGRFDHVRENLELFFKRWGQRFDHNWKFIQHNTLEKTRIIWEGSQFVNHSLALVNREMCRRLAKLGDIELSLVTYEPHQFDASADPVKYGTIDNLLNHRLSAPTDVHIRHQWPPIFKPPVEGHWVMIQPWEYGSLPKDWVKPMRSQVDELWVPSNYVREVYIESGIPASKVFVIPNGVDYENFDPKAQPKPLDTAKSLKFLFVGGTIPRKGIDVLLDAYTSAFSRGDDVCLVIKDMGADTFYRGQSGAERIIDIQKREDAPEILYLKEDLPDKKMAGLYTACDCLVHPYRGEGFGLPVAEAMACGLPVVVTRGGACDDFCNDNNSLFIESQRRPIIMNDAELCDTGWVLEPNRDDLIRLLRFLYENNDEGRKIGAVAAREIRELVSWEKSADLVVQRIKELKNKPIIRLQLNECQKSHDNYNSDLLLYTSIQEQISNGDFEGAIAKLEDLVGSKPELAVAYNDLGVLYHRQEKNALALTQYRRAVDLEPGNTNFRKNLADLLVVTFGEYEEALQHYVAVLAADPKDAEALFATGHICARLERYDDAAEFYARVLEIEPDNSDAKNWLTKMGEKASANCMKENLNDRYLALLSEIDHEDLAGAVQKIENFIEMYPNHGQAHNDLGVLYYKNEYKTKVLARYLKAIELEPENVTFRKNLADFLYVEEGRLEEALENYVEVLRFKPDDVETLLITGHLCAAIEQFEDAMSFYNKVLDIEPGYLEARKNLEVLERRQISMLYKEERGEEKTDGAAEINQAEPQASVDELTIVKDGVVEELINKADLLFQQERIDQAVDAMLKAIAVNQLDGRTYIELARQLINHGSNENALEVLAEMPANQPEALEKQKLVLEGYCQEGMGNYAAAKKCNDGVLAREPNNAKASNLNGILAYRNGDQETAEQHFKRAIELDSEYGEPHTNLGALVWENGEPRMALEHYERGFSISPTDIDVANAYHEAVTATGEYKRAEKAARSALKKYPQCRKVLYLLVDTLIRQEKNEEALKELENALSTFGVDEGLLDTALAFRERVGKIQKTGSDKKPGVSLCMIVKDEEDNLARCLASVKPIVDEMIVVDTGSTDRTRDIAEFLGARVYDFEWKGDFAEARNFSLSKAKGGWILILDADEVISSKDYVKFQSIVRRCPKKPIAYSITTRNYCTLANTIGWETNLGEYPAEEAGFGWLPSAKVRLFYGRNRVRFEGAVHEMVDPALKRAHIPVKSCHIPVHHYGRLDTERMNKKGKIYYDLGRRKLEESNCDHAAVRELATQATILGKNEEAVDLWHRFLKMSPPDRAIAEAQVNLATLYLRLQDYKAARNISEKVLSKVPEMKEARYNLALSELYLGNPGRTVEVLECMVKDHPLYPPAQFILAATCFINGKKEQSESLLENLKKGPFGPVLTRSFAELVRDLNAAGRFDYAQQLLESALENKIVDTQILTQLSLTLPNSPQPVAVAG